MLAAEAILQEKAKRLSPHTWMQRLLNTLTAYRLYRTDLCECKTGGDVLKLLSIKLQRNKTTLLVSGFILVVVIIYGCKDCTMLPACKINSG